LGSGRVHRTTATPHCRKSSLWLCIVWGLLLQEIKTFFALQEGKVSYISASKQSGILIGLMVWPTLSDVIGRQAVLLSTLLPLAGWMFAEVTATTACAPHPFPSPRAVTTCLQWPVDASVKATYGDGEKSSEARRGWSPAQAFVFKHNGSFEAFLLFRFLGGTFAGENPPTSCL
jgi:MFS family permease